MFFFFAILKVIYIARTSTLKFRIVRNYLFLDTYYDASKIKSVILCFHNLFFPYLVYEISKAILAN